MNPMQLALFDLDHTLIPFDSGSVFTRFLAERGALPEGFAAQYLDYCHQYAAGRLDMRAMHRFTVGALAVHTPQRLAGWLREFEALIVPLVPPAALALVREHQAAGHLCALVTATTRIVAAPFGRVLGLAEVLCTEPAYDARGHCTGEVIGEPCFREHKLGHVQAWLARRGLALGDVQRSWFYSDSANDLALLAAVSDPVAVNPDVALAAHAAAAGWPVRHISALPPAGPLDRPAACP
jgi:HAD superfamily hydrolase (TIGR01490 family)